MQHFKYSLIQFPLPSNTRNFWVVYETIDEIAQASANAIWYALLPKIRQKAEYIKYETPALNPPTNKKRILSDKLNQYSLIESIIHENRNC